jgi:hypothetical protein
MYSPQASTDSLKALALMSLNVVDKGRQNELTTLALHHEGAVSPSQLQNDL